MIIEFIVSIMIVNHLAVSATISLFVNPSLLAPSI